MFRAVSRVGISALVVIGGLALAGPASMAHTSAPPCFASGLAVTKAGQEGAAGNRYLAVKVTNTGDARCRLTGFPTFTWRRHGHDIGWSSVPEPGQTAHTVSIAPGHAAYTTLHWVDPGVVPAARCHATRTTGVRMTLPHRPHVYRMPIRVRVCTTKAYRPTAFPVRGTAGVS
jgi:hypothetical protein